MDDPNQKPNTQDDLPVDTTAQNDVTKDQDEKIGDIPQSQDTVVPAGEKTITSPETISLKDQTSDKNIGGDSEEVSSDRTSATAGSEDAPEETELAGPPVNDLETTPESPAKWYVVHTYSGHENRVAQTLKQRVESEHLEDKILDVLVPTQEKIEIRGGKKETVKEKIFPGYILVKMILDDLAWLAVRTTQGVTSFVGMGNKPTPIPDFEVQTIVKYMQQGGPPQYKTVFGEGDTVKIVDGPFAEFIGKVETVDKEKGKVRILVSIFGRETPVELDFLQINKL